MLILQLWLSASLLVAAFWALAGLLVGTPEPAPRGGAEPSEEPAFEPQGEAA